MSARHHRAVLAIAVGVIVAVALLAPMFAAAHTVRIAYRCDGGDHVTFFAGSYHGDAGVFGGIIIDGTTFDFIDSTPVLPEGVAPNRITCSDTPAVVKWQSVTLHGVANGLHSITTTATSAIEDPWPGCFPADLDIQCASDTDTDGDGVADDVDNCPGTPNPDQADADGDGIGDACDACPFDSDNDADGDGVCGDVDNCPATPNDQADIDGDGIGDACDACPFDAANDVDGDGVCGDVDNCPDTSNPDQADADADGTGDACDPDEDGDGVPNGSDSCPLTPLGEVVDANGCSIAQLCPCAGWTTHGGYVSCVANASQGFVEAGLITEAEKDSIVSAAAQSSCGK